MQPILRGLVKYLEDGRMIWEGKWGMDAAAFDEDDDSRAPHQQQLADSITDKLNNFRYVSATHVSMNVGDQVSFKGHFEVSSANKTSKSQFSDKFLELEVLREENDGRTRKVIGRGANRFGNFALEGEYDTSTKQLEIQRIYENRPAVKLGLKPSSSSSSSLVVQESANETPEASIPMSSEFAVVSPGATSSGSGTTRNSAEATPPGTTASLDLPEQASSVVALQPLELDLKYLPEARKMLSDLKARDFNRWFSIPVDAKALGLRDYHNVVKQPMDLGTIQAKLDTKHYKSLDQIFADMRLTFVNALMYNPRGSPVYRQAQELSTLLEQAIVTLGSKTNTFMMAAAPSIGSEMTTASIGKRNRIKKKFFEPGAGNTYVEVTDDEYVVKDLVSIKKKKAKMSRSTSSSSQNPQAAYSEPRGGGKATSSKKGKNKGVGANTTSKKKKATLVVLKPTGGVRTNQFAHPAIFNPEMDSPLAFLRAHAVTTGGGDEDEAVDSFDELDLEQQSVVGSVEAPPLAATPQRPEDDEDDQLFMTPSPASIKHSRGTVEVDDLNNVLRDDGAREDDDLIIPDLVVGDIPMSAGSSFAIGSRFNTGNSLAVSPTDICMDDEF